MLLEISVPGLIHCLMRGIKVASFQHGTGNKKPSLVVASQPLKVHCSRPILARLYFLLKDKLSSFSAVSPGPPIWTRLSIKFETAILRYQLHNPELAHYIGDCMLDKSSS